MLEEKFGDNSLLVYILNQVPFVNIDLIVISSISQIHFVVLNLNQMYIFPSVLPLFHNSQWPIKWFKRHNWKCSELFWQFICSSLNWWLMMLNCWFLVDDCNLLNASIKHICLKFRMIERAPLKTSWSLLLL